MIRLNQCVDLFMCNDPLVARRPSIIADDPLENPRAQTSARFAHFTQRVVGIILCVYHHARFPSFFWLPPKTIVPHAAR